MPAKTGMGNSTGKQSSRIKLYCILGCLTLANLRQRIRLAARFGPPHSEVVGEGAGADLSQVVGFGEVFDGDDGVTHDQFLPRISRI